MNEDPILLKNSMREILKVTFSTSNPKSKNTFHNSIHFYMYVKYVSDYFNKVAQFILTVHSVKEKHKSIFCGMNLKCMSITICVIQP